METCASLNPDLLVLPLRLTELAPKLNELGLTYIFVNPNRRICFSKASRCWHGIPMPS